MMKYTVALVFIFINFYTYNYLASEAVYSHKFGHPLML